MSWLFSRVLVEEYSPEGCSDGGRSAPLRSMPSRHPFLHNGKTTAFSTRSLYGLTCERLTAARGAELLMSYRAAFRAKTSAARAKAKASGGGAAGCGRSSLESFARLDRASRSWRTSHISLDGESTSFSGTWPKAGTMRNGVCWERTTPELPTSASASGFWPTPRAEERGQYQRDRGEIGKERATLTGSVKVWFPTPRATSGGGRISPDAKDHRLNLVERIKMLPTPTTQDAKNNGSPSQQTKRNTVPLNAVVGGALNPQFVEWLMGWPLNWTSTERLRRDTWGPWEKAFRTAFRGFAAWATGRSL